MLEVLLKRVNVFVYKCVYWLNLCVYTGYMCIYGMSMCIYGLFVYAECTAIFSSNVSLSFYD